MGSIEGSSAIGTFVGGPEVGAAVGSGETLGARLGDGLGFGDSDGIAEGAGTVGVDEGAGEGLGEVVGGLLGRLETLGEPVTGAADGALRAPSLGKNGLSSFGETRKFLLVARLTSDCQSPLGSAVTASNSSRKTSFTLRRISLFGHDPKLCD